MPFTPKVTLRAQAERRLMELRARDPNEADLTMRRAEELRGAPEPQSVDQAGGRSWTVYASRAAGMQILEQLNGDVHVVITSRDLASAVFKQLTESLKGASLGFTTVGQVMDGWRRWFERPARSFRTPRHRARKKGPPWRRRRRR